ncbi:MAG TPA: tetratricopeptide repeat protein [Methanoregulaceae archaeon]|nr:tetratricopeptide repeat protein [Methanoregulaceae archaeon]
MQGFFTYLPLALLSALLVLAGTGSAANFSDDIAAEAEVKAFSSIDTASLAVYAGQNALQSGRYDEAVEHFTEAVDADPSWMAAWYLKAYSLSRLNRTEEALAAVDQALLLDPEDRDANNLKADILESLGRGEEAARARSVAEASSVTSPTIIPLTATPTTKAPASAFLGLSAILITACLIRIRERL